MSMRALGISMRFIPPKGTGVAFSPSALFASGEQGVWFDPSDFSTMFQDSAGTTPVTATGQSVGKILDKSGRGNHATQTTAGLRPTLQQDGNGKYYLSFDGVDDGLVTSSINFAGAQSLSFFAGVRKSSSSFGYIAILSNNDFNWGIAALGAGTVTGAIGSGDGYSGFSHGDIDYNANQNAQIYAASPDLAVLSSIHDIPTDLSTMRRNGVAGTSATGDQATGSFYNNAIYVGYKGGSYAWFGGRIYSLIVRMAITSAPDIVNVENWINAKTGAY